MFHSWQLIRYVYLLWHRLYAYCVIVCILYYSIYMIFCYLIDASVLYRPLVLSMLKGTIFVFSFFNRPNSNPTSLVHCSAHSLSIMTNHAPHSAKSALYVHSFISREISWPFRLNWRPPLNMWLIVWCWCDIHIHVFIDLTII
jgi:hypothetical protein